MNLNAVSFKTSNETKCKTKLLLKEHIIVTVKFALVNNLIRLITQRTLLCDYVIKLNRIELICINF